MNFENWLVETRNLTRPDKYSSTINTISNDLVSESLISGSIYNISDWVILESLMTKYFEIPRFFDKNETGHNMYSRAFKHYINFRKQGN